MKFKRFLRFAAALSLSVTAVLADSIFVANSGVNTITKYDANGNGSLFTNAFINGPTGIALDASGNLYVATKSNTIERFGPDGTDLGVFVTTGLNNPMGLAFDRKGNLYAANFAANSVEVFAPAGRDLGVFASVTQPTGLAFDPAGNLYVASFANSIQRFAPDGALLPALTSSALNHPEGLVFDSLGSLYVANSSSNTVETFSPASLALQSEPQTLGNSAPTPVPGGLTQDVFIAYRTDGQPGDGTQSSPFDGSTPTRLDGIFKSFYESGTINITFHIGPGTFQMKGAWDYDWGMLSGWHIKGAGRTLTIIQQVVGARGISPGSNGALFSNGAALTYDNQSVEDLACDCAWFRSGPGGDNSRPHGNFQGINLYGANPTIRNVKVTGCGWRDDECFAILTSGGINDRNLPDNALYENVEVSNGATGPYSTHLTGMAMINLAAMGNDRTPVYAKNGRIINCTFNLPDAGNAGGMPAGYDGGIVTGCTFIGYWHGIFHDTFVSKNVAITGNTIVALFADSSGILFNSGTANAPCDNISIVGNTVFSAGGVGFASAVVNSSIGGNRIGLAPGNNADYCIFLDTATVRNISVLGNNIDAGIPYLSRNTIGCSFRTNRTPAGILAIADTPSLPPSPDGANYGRVGVFDSAGMSGPMGLACDSADDLYVVNGLNATIEKVAAGGMDTTFAATSFKPAFIAVQRGATLANISTRLKVLGGENVLDSGFIVAGSGTKKVLIRGLGPSLAGAGIEDALADPSIELHGGVTNATIASNGNWKSDQQAEIEATGIPPVNDSEAALIASLSAGAYTVIERGDQGSTGVALLEIYDLNPGLGPALANISTRGFVGPDSMMIAGFIAASSTGGTAQVTVRALGPSLGAAGIVNPLADPVLELHDSNGTLIAGNDNWRNDQEAEIETTGISPANDAEAAIVMALAPGAYTAIESGKNGGTGVGLVEVYTLR